MPSNAVMPNRPQFNNQNLLHTSILSEDNSTETPSLICIQDKSFNILREPLQNLLDALSEDITCKYDADAKLRLKVHNFSSSIALHQSEQHPYLDKNELLQCAKLMRKVSKSLSGGNKKHRVSTHLLSKHLYCAWVQKDVSDRRLKLLQENSRFLQPGNSSHKSVNVGTGAGIPAAHLTSLMLNTGLTVSKTTDCDDEGIVEKSKETNVSAGITASLNLTSHANIKGSINASHSRSSRGVNFASLEDYVDSLCSKLHYHGLNKRMGKKHSVRYYQNTSLNNLDRLNHTFSLNGKTPFLFTCSAPHQNNVKLKESHGTVVSASLGANISPLAELSVGATVGYTHEEKDIYVNFRNSMALEVMSENSSFYHNEIERLAPHFNLALKDLLGEFENNNFLIADAKILSPAIPQNILEASLSRLEGLVDVYCMAVRGSDAGDKQCSQLKHQLETRWGVEGKGRYGFLQCSEVMLALLSKRLKTVSADSLTLNALTDKTRAIDSKITSPSLSYDKSKLEKYTSFNRKLKVELNNNSFDMSFNVGGSVLNGSLTPSAKVHVMIKNNTTRQPGRLRAGNYRDITFDFNTDVNLANIPDNIISAIATQSGIPTSILSNTLTQSISTNVDFSLGGKIMIRYFRPEWSSSLAHQNNKYSHQFTRVFANTSASASLNVSEILPVGLNTGFSVSSDKVTHEYLGDKTLSYILIRYAYCKGIWDEGGKQIWTSLMENNHKSLTKIMNDITVPDSQLHKEANLLINEYRHTANDEQVASIETSLGSIFHSLAHAGETTESFNSGIGALQQILDLQQQETGRIFREGLSPQKFSKKMLLTR